MEKLALHGLSYYLSHERYLIHIRLVRQELNCTDNALSEVGLTLSCANERDKEQTTEH